MKLVVAGMLVVACSVAGTACRSEKAAPPPEGFVDVSDTIGRTCSAAENTYECARAVEQYRLAKGVNGVSRVGKRLSIALGNGTRVDLADSPDPAAEDYVAYSYTEYLACFGYHLVHRQYADAESYLAIQAEHGARMELPAVPVLAPDCGRLAAVSPAVLQVWRWNENGRATLEWGYQPDAPWTPGPFAWQGPTALRLSYEEVDDPGTRRTLTARLFTDGWRREP